LVVLSACDTALGQVHIGQGVMGLQRSFVVAGMDTLVMSLWRVPDEETAELMKVFYKEILMGKGCGKALVTPQRKFSDRNVYLWEAFICQGNTEPISSEVIGEIKQRIENRSHAPRGV
jgi:CHAT domain-containing protein